MLNKKAQGMSTSTIILLVLGVAVLAILIVGFTMGWKNVAPFISSSNVDQISTACATACSLGSTYDYCFSPRDLKDSEGNNIKASCAVLAAEPKMNLYGIESCSLDCDTVCSEIKVNEIAGVKGVVGEPSLYDVTSLANDLDAGEACFILEN